MLSAGLRHTGPTADIQYTCPGNCCFQSLSTITLLVTENVYFTQKKCQIKMLSDDFLLTWSVFLSSYKYQFMFCLNSSQMNSTFVLLQSEIWLKLETAFHAKLFCFQNGCGNIARSHSTFGVNSSTFFFSRTTAIFGPIQHGHQWFARWWEDIRYDLPSRNLLNKRSHWCHEGPLSGTFATERKHGNSE